MEIWKGSIQGNKDMMTGGWEIVPTRYNPSPISRFTKLKLRVNQLREELDNHRYCLKMAATAKNFDKFTLYCG